MPKHAVRIYGDFIRQALSKDPDEAEAYAERLSNVLEGSWSATTRITPVDVVSVVESFKPRSYLLSEIAEEYLALRKIDQTPPRVALSTFISLAGDREVSDYTREDVKLFVRHLILRGNKTATVRRRINSLSAILNYAYSELDLDKRNPFTRLMIQGEGEDTFKRGVFTREQLKQGYDKALSSGSTVKLLMPLLGETGCRLAEIVGLRLEDIDLQEDLIHIRPNSARRLKTPNSTRTLPLVGYAKLAMERAVQSSDGQWLFPRYIKDGTCKATHASNALNKWLKRDFDGLTAHCLRHTMRDRLRAVECPLELIDQIGGWRCRMGIGSLYGDGYPVQIVKKHLLVASIKEK
ncbi:tyrosine-type recombinase/integrase [Sulfitobacter sp. JBTF-M27]|uniref:Tyrosine-type recombinase/integrase n=1 Tax=Sulfitobacter sediminilitoris TaxID=2698830 RepID=A0A6P0CEG6_9RHOB|nr:tyrosine-type recombinase/integrase [Sulfitobacter sediminilitoris]